MTQLKRELSFFHALSLVVGTIVGTGIFLKSGIMTQQLGSPAWVLGAWVLAGGISFLGALAYGELASLYPEAGGEYVFLKQTYGSTFAFFFGWTRFLIAGPGSIAAYAVGAATFLSGSFSGVGDSVISNQIGMALLFILLFTLINCFPVRRAGDVQGVLTVIKFVLIFALIFGTLLLVDHPKSPLETLFYKSTSGEGIEVSFGAFAAAVVAALWAYDGWNNLVMAAGEVKNPKKNLPLALGVGFLIVLILYLSVNVGYFLALPFEKILDSFSKTNPAGESVGQMAYASFTGIQAKGITAFALALSALGAMNGSILTGSRVPYAMAEDGAFFKIFSRVSKRGVVPVVSVCSQGILAAAFALTGSFDQITDMVVFSSWIFYGACVASIFIIRNRKKKQQINLESSENFQMPGYPILPAIFVLVAVILLITTWTQNFKESTFGLLLIVSGWPIYYLCKKKNGVFKTKA